MSKTASEMPKCIVCGSAVESGSERCYNCSERRDRMAMAALTGWLANTRKIGGAEEYSTAAYDYADAMLKARKKKKFHLTKKAVDKVRNGK